MWLNPNFLSKCTTFFHFRVNWRKCRLRLRMGIFSQIQWWSQRWGPAWLPPAQPVFISPCNQSSPLGICCRVSVGVPWLRLGLWSCVVAWKLRRGAHLLLPGVSPDIKRSGPLAPAWLTAQRELTTVCEAEPPCLCDRRSGRLVAFALVSNPPVSTLPPADTSHHVFFLWTCGGVKSFLLAISLHCSPTGLPPPL